MNQESVKIDEREGLPSASSLDADMRCLGRRNLIRETVAKAPEGEAAKRGTKIHKALEENNFEGLTESERITASIIMYQEGQVVEKYHLETAQQKLETRYWMIDDETLDLSFSGRLDKMLINDGKGMAIDYKTGFSFVVPIDRNWQIRAAAVLMSEHEKVSEVVGVLIHPHHPETFRQEAVFNSGHLQTYRQTILMAVREMRLEDAPRTPNPVSCMYCPARRSCKEHSNWVQSIVDQKDNPETMSPEQRGERLRELKYAGKELDSQEELIKETLKKDPTAVEGWRLAPQTRRVIVDIPEAEKIVKHTWGPTVWEDSLSVSIPSLETSVYQKIKSSDAKFTENMASEEVVKHLGSIIKKKSLEPKLMPVSKSK